MKKRQLTILILIASCFIVFNSAKGQSKSDLNGSFFQIGINYFMPSKPGLANYLIEFSDSLNFASPFSLSRGQGITLGFTNHKNSFEFNASGDLMWSHDYQNAGDTIAGTIATTDINLNFGANFFPVRWLFVGGNLSICNGSEKYKAGNQSSTVLLESQGDGFSNIFNGYSIGAKAQAGFNINVSRKNEFNTYLRLFAFYEYGLTAYDFYKTFEHRMKNYSGNKKTKLYYPGITLLMQFRGN